MLTQLMAIQSHHCSLNILTINIMATTCITALAESAKGAISLVKNFISRPNPMVPTTMMARLMSRVLLLAWIFITSWVSWFMFLDQVKKPTNCMTKL